MYDMPHFLDEKHISVATCVMSQCLERYEYACEVCSENVINNAVWSIACNQWINAAIALKGD